MSAAPAPHPDTSRNRLTAILLMCAAVLCFSLLDASAKWLGSSMHTGQVVSARYIISVALVSIILNPWSRPGIVKTSRPWLQGIRSLLLLTSTALNFFALKYLQLAETVSIMFATPFLVALLAGPILGEWAGPRRLIAIAVGFVGVLVITRPGLGGLHPAALLTVCGCFCYAFYSISTRMLAASDSPETTMFYSGMVGAVVMVPLVPLFWSWPADGLSWLLMLSTGLFGALGHWLLILAHQRAPASMLSPFNYSQIVWMVALGWFVFGQIPDRYTFIGASIVIASGLYLLYRERVRAVPEGSARLD
ncbi:MAG TPA: DMT family transporter [Bosea sp. (in: a-proteobacteria)]|uniref:DMT family transporter n=1 Tax=Bosea sp. (in: a-proteobacteria) TaxID=1871050 RepID=UPI002E134854|nr:DMT family transporter [Bosea sp. (in: a-proteobacteria)]